MTRKIELSQEYVDGIRAEYEPNWGPLGWLVYKRTYARWIEEEHRKEEWWETVKRVVEGNINLDPRLQYDIVNDEVLEELQKEAEELFYLIYKLVLTPPGRGLWISGTEFAERTGDALNNCWFVSVKPQKYGDSQIVPGYVKERPETELPSMPFSFLFDQSMKGGGVGFNVGRHNIKEMPDKKYNLDLTVVCDSKHDNFDEMVEYGVEEPSEKKEGVWNRYLVPDTREGWVEALAWVIDSHFDDELAGKDLMIDVSRVRPSGERIKGFGGIASGPAPLVQLLVDVNELLNEHEEVTSVVATDIMNMIGRTVIAGNVRRTAEIAIGDPDDNAFLTMKQDKEKLNSHRWASNNTVLIDNDFSEFGAIADGIIMNGEPGIANMFLARNYGRLADGFQRGVDKDVDGVNPCAEITAENGEPCNLFEVFPYMLDKEGIDYELALRLATRYAKRVTFSTYDWEVSRHAIQKNRRIGVSISGQQDWMLDRFNGAVDYWEMMSNGKYEFEKPVYKKEVVKTLDEMYTIVQKEDREYSQELQCEQSIKTTTVKPSGTVALLNGMSAGVHWHYSDFYIRRMRFQHDDPLLEVCREAGYHIEPDVYSDRTSVVEFPVKTRTSLHPDFKTAGGEQGVSIEEQFAYQELIQAYWADNSVSCTVTFSKEEEEDIAPLLNYYKTRLKSTSMLPYEDHGYEQAPYEPISMGKYEELMAGLEVEPSQLFELQAEEADLELVGLDGCESGVCPIK